MTKERKMAVVTILKKIIRLYEETTFIPRSVSFSNEKLRIQSSDLTGELLDYCQHVVFNEDLFFANQNFNIILLALDSPEGQSNVGPYKIFFSLVKGNTRYSLLQIQMIFFSVISKMTVLQFTRAVLEILISTNSAQV